MGSLIDKIVAMDCTFFIYRIAEYKNTQKREHILTHMTKTIQKKPKPIHKKKDKSLLYFLAITQSNTTLSTFPFTTNFTYYAHPFFELSLSLYLYIFTQTLTYTSQHNTNH